MTRNETIADFIRGSYWIETASQGDAYLTWEELARYPNAQEFWLSVAKRFEQRLERGGFMIIKQVDWV